MNVTTQVIFCICIIFQPSFIQHLWECLNSSVNTETTEAHLTEQLLINNFSFVKPIALIFEIF